MASKAARHEESRFVLKGGGGALMSGFWTHYEVFPADGKMAVGMCSQRSGGGWLCTLPVFEMQDNGITDVRRKVGHVKGRGATPQEALAEADRLALMGPEAMETYEQKEIV